MSKEKCDCYIRGISEIIYCPTHAAAFQMRAAIETSIDIMTAGPSFHRDWVQERLERALSLAEGKEAEHGK